MTLWQERVTEAKRTLETILKELDSNLECHVDGHRGFYNDIFDVIVTRGHQKAFAVVTVETCINAKTDSAEMREAFRKVISELKDKPDSVFLVTTRGIKKVPIGSEGKALQEGEGWRRFEDKATLEEADKIAEQFLKRIRD